MRKSRDQSHGKRFKDSSTRPPFEKPNWPIRSPKRPLYCKCPIGKHAVGKSASWALLESFNQSWKLEIDVEKLSIATMKIFQLRSLISISGGNFPT